MAVTARTPFFTGGVGGILGVRINAKKTMPVSDIEQFKRHRGSALHRVEIPTGRTEAAVAAERDEFNFPQWGQPTLPRQKRDCRSLPLIHFFDDRLAWM